MSDTDTEQADRRLAELLAEDRAESAWWQEFHARLPACESPRHAPVLCGQCRAPESKITSTGYRRWLTLMIGDDCPQHFCGWACLAEYVEHTAASFRRMAEEHELADPPTPGVRWAHLRHEAEELRRRADVRARRADELEEQAAKAHAVAYPKREQAEPAPETAATPADGAGAATLDAQ